jgi:hypothetical protein
VARDVSVDEHLLCPSGEQHNTGPICANKLGAESSAMAGDSCQVDYINQDFGTGRVAPIIELTPQGLKQHIGQAIRS